MKPREIPDIQEAEALLIKAENSFPSEESAKNFETAYEILNDYIEYEKPDEEIEIFISNLKYSYARTVLTHLNDIPTKDIHIYVHYTILLIIKMKQEFEKLIKTRPDLDVIHKSCKKRFEPQLKEIVRELKKNA